MPAIPTVIVAMTVEVQILLSEETVMMTTVMATATGRQQTTIGLEATARITLTGRIAPRGLHTTIRLAAIAVAAHSVAEARSEEVVAEAVAAVSEVAGDV